jgi:hypothetical protein
VVISVYMCLQEHVASGSVADRSDTDI